jgi:hypothetical protein
MGLRLSGKEMAAHPVMTDMDLAGNTKLQIKYLKLRITRRL